MLDCSPLEFIDIADLPPPPSAQGGFAGLCRQPGSTAQQPWRRSDEEGRGSDGLTALSEDTAPPMPLL